MQVFWNERRYNFVESERERERERKKGEIEISLWKDTIKGVGS